MSDIPPSKKRKRNEISTNCSLCNEECDEDQSTFSLESWKRLKETALKWKDFNIYGNVYEKVNWVAGPNGVFFHTSCKINMQSSYKHERARKRCEEKQEPKKENKVSMEATICTRQSASGDKCVWCMRGSKKERLSKISSIDAWNSFKKHATYIKDDELKIRTLALIASITDPLAEKATKIYYHRTCWKTHVRVVYDVTVDNNETTSRTDNISLEIQTIFLNHVREVIFDYNEPRTLISLLRDYRQIEEKHDGLNKGYWDTKRIKNILIEQFGNKIGFHNRYHKNESTIVYCTEYGGTYVEAAINSWGISDEQLIKNVAKRFKDRLGKAEGIKWPPTVEDIETEEIPDPLLVKFLVWLRNPASQNFEDDLDPIVLTLASLLRSYISGKRSIFKTRLSVTAHGLTRLREIVDLLRKLGLGISYQDVKNLYIAWANVELMISSCPKEIADDHPGTAILDNDDFKEDTLTGANTSHRTNVMFVQRSDQENTVNKASSIEMVKPGDIQTLVEENIKITPYKTLKQGVPPIRAEIDSSVPTVTEIRKEEVLHTLIRMDNKNENVDPVKQRIGSFAGFQSLIQPEVVKSKPYYFLTLPKPPYKTVVHEVMMRMLTVIEEKKMPFLQLVGDQPVYTLIVQIRNENPQMFKKIIPILGPFHTQCSFITAINKRFSGSGITDLIVSADIIADKSVEQAFRAKHFRRIVRALQLVYECLQRNIIRNGIREGLVLSQELQSLLDKLRDPRSFSKEQLNEFMENIRENNEFESFMNAAYKIVHDYKSEMANYWLSFMDMVEILMMNIHALKVQNWEMFKDSLRMMIPWMQIYDNNHYGKWLVEFWLEMSTLPEEINAYMKEGIFVHSMTGNSYSCLPLDLWIEMTMNKGSKLKAGWKNILKNEKMLFCHTRNANFVNRIRVSLHKLANLKASKSKCHKENTNSRLKNDEIAVQDLENCIIEFNCNPFDPANSVLKTLQSGATASVDLVTDFTTALPDGEKLLQIFLKDRMFSRNTSFDAVMHRNSRKSFSNPPCNKSDAKAISKSVAMENEAMSQIIVLCSENNITLEAIMNYRVTEECLSIYNTNGAMVKVQKSKLIESFSFTPLPYRMLLNSIALLDMGFIWRKSMPTTEDRQKNDETVFTWRDYAKKMFDMIEERHSTAQTIILVNDPYDLETTIKDYEQDRRNSQYLQGTKNVFIKPNNKLPNSRELSDFFKNKGNKIRLQEFLKIEFSNYLSSLQGKTMLYSVQTVCIDLKSEERINEFECNHMEADTILFFIYSQLRVLGRNETVVIDAEDTDVVVLSARVSHEVDGTLAIKRKKTVFDCSKLCSEELSKIIVQVHVATGCDSISAFYGHGKKSAMKQVLKSNDVNGMLENVGSHLPITNSVMDSIRMFTLKVVYNEHGCTSLGKARARKWMKMKKKSTQRLPPNEDSHKQRGVRVNYTCHMLLNYHKKDILSPPFCHGWVLTTEGKCYPRRYTEPPLPSKFADIVQIHNSDEKVSDENMNENDLNNSENLDECSSDDNDDVDKRDSESESEDDEY